MWVTHDQAVIDSPMRRVFEDPQIIDPFDGWF